MNNQCHDTPNLNLLVWVLCGTYWDYIFVDGGTVITLTSSRSTLSFRFELSPVPS